MKILVLGALPQTKALASDLTQKGVLVFSASDRKEAEFMVKLHQLTIDLIVGENSEGLELNQWIKNTPPFNQLPYLHLSSEWTESECIDHQNTNLGAHAYLRIPFESKAAALVIEEILGQSLEQDVTLSRAFIAEATSHQAQEEIQLESTSDVYQSSGSSNDLGLEIPLMDGDLDLKLESTSLLTEAPETTSNTTDSHQLPTISLETEPAIELENFSLDSFTHQEQTPSEIEVAEDKDLSSLISQLQTDLSEAPRSEHSETTKNEKDFIAELDDQSYEQAPYLSSKPIQVSLGLGPVEDSIVPGGAAQAPDVEVLKKYLALREQDVAALSQQLKDSKTLIKKMEDASRHEKAMISEYCHLVQEQEKRIQNFEFEKKAALESLQEELDEVKFEFKKKKDQNRVFELKINEAQTETQRLKERVRQDIRKIRTREKELENRLEIMKKDSEALLHAREEKIIDLKRKLDSLEFSMDLLQSKWDQEKNLNEELKQKLSKAAQVVRLAGGYLFDEKSSGDLYSDATDLIQGDAGYKGSKTSKDPAA